MSDPDFFPPDAEAADPDDDTHVIEAARTTIGIDGFTNAITTLNGEVAAADAEAAQVRAARASTMDLARKAFPDHFTQARLARLTGMSQQAVSKAIAPHSPDRPDAPFLLGRLIGLGQACRHLGGAGSVRPEVAADKMWRTGSFPNRSLHKLVLAIRADAATLRTPIAFRLNAGLADITRLALADGPEGDAADIRAVLVSAVTDTPRNGPAAHLTTPDRQEAALLGAHAEQRRIRGLPAKGVTPLYDGVEPLKPDGRKIRQVMDLAAALDPATIAAEEEELRASLAQE